MCAKGDCAEVLQCGRICICCCHSTSEFTAFQFPSQRDRAGVLRVKVPGHGDDSFWCVQPILNWFLNERECYHGVSVLGGIEM